MRSLCTHRQPSIACSACCNAAPLPPRPPSYLPFRTWDVIHPASTIPSSCGRTWLQERRRKEGKDGGSGFIHRPAFSMAGVAGTAPAHAALPTSAACYRYRHCPGWLTAPAQPPLRLWRCGAPAFLPTPARHSTRRLPPLRTPYYYPTRLPLPGAHTTCRLPPIPCCLPCQQWTTMFHCHLPHLPRQPYMCRASAMATPWLLALALRAHTRRLSTRGNSTFVCPSVMFTTLPVFLAAYTFDHHDAGCFT